MQSYFEDEPLRIGDQTQLLLDESIVEDRWRLTRVLHRPQKFLRNPIVLRDKPWEGDSVSRPWVMWDEEHGRYRMWYQCFAVSSYWGGSGAPYYIGYAESEDGINWQKPRLEGRDFGGYSNTNVVYCGTFKARVQGVQILKDEDASDPGRRYKMICVEQSPDGDNWIDGVGIAYSPDGFKWRMPQGEVILDYHSDCFNHVARDPVRGRWLLYCRPRAMFSAGRRELTGGLKGYRHRVRRVAVMTSRDFVHWSYPRTVMYPDERDTPDYDAATVFRYGGQFLMLYCAMEGDTDGSTEVRLASSRDGLAWERFYTREAFIPRGREGDWDARQVHSACPPIRQGEDLLIYYTGSNRGQNEGTGTGGIGLARMKVDRFVEERAGDEPGFLLTREFLLEGKGLFLNTYMKGMPYKEQGIRVEIVRRPPLGGHRGFSQPYEGFSLEECDPILANRTDAPVTWNGSADLSALQGKPVYVRFEIRNMGLFSFRVGGD